LTTLYFLFEKFIKKTKSWFLHHTTFVTHFSLLFVYTTHFFPLFPSHFWKWTLLDQWNQLFARRNEFAEDNQNSSDRLCVARHVAQDRTVLKPHFPCIRNWNTAANKNWRRGMNCNTKLLRTQTKRSTNRQWFRPLLLAQARTILKLKTLNRHHVANHRKNHRQKDVNRRKNVWLDAKQRHRVTNKINSITNIVCRDCFHLAELHWLHHHFTAKTNHNFSLMAINAYVTKMSQQLFYLNWLKTLRML